MSEITFVPISGKLGIHSPAEAQALVEDIWEKNRYLRHIELAPGDIVVDVGANVGIFSLQAAHLGASVLAIEPNPETFELLERNLDSNGLIAQATLLNLAVAGHAGNLELTIPESRGLYSLGSATTSQATRNQLASLSEAKMRTVVVACKPLGQILSESLPAHASVRFLKMDCEGAEWEIFGSMDRSLASRIQNLALETHSGYGEAELVAKLEELGFQVIGFEKRSGVFQTGYVYASRPETGNGQPQLKDVVAILEGPDHAFLGEPVRFHSSPSFGFASPPASLRREWRIDGELVDGKESILAKFAKTGIHSVSVRVTSGGRTDLAEAEITILDKGYLEPIADSVTLPEKGRSKIGIGNRTRFRIPSEYMPKTWTAKGVVVSLARTYPEGNVCGPLRLAFNGQAFEIDKVYSEIRLGFAASSLDIHFLLEAGTPEEIDISWWFIQGGQPPAEGPVVDEAARTVRLAGPSQESFLVFDGSMRFLIPHDKLPREWTPKLLKVGIASVSIADEDASELEGHFEEGGERRVFADWYHEAAISTYSEGKDSEFSVHLPKTLRLKVIWWCE